MEITFLGTGTSQGIPVIACGCDVCISTDQKDKRLRSSILISINRKNFVVDTGPDFRAQMLREKVQQLDAIFFTHEHKDHIAGLDDVRAFNFKQKKDMPVFASEQVQKALKREFYYAFEEKKYPGVPEITLNTISDLPFIVEEIKIVPIQVMHYKMPVTAFRIDNFAYITDASSIAPKEKEKLKGVEFLVVNALRKTDHIAHFKLNEALELIKEINPKRAYLTHISHLMGENEIVSKELPEHVSIAYDGLKINI